MSAVRLDLPTDVVITPDRPLSVDRSVFSCFAYLRQGCYLAEQQPVERCSSSDVWLRIAFCIREANRLDHGEQTPPADRILMNRYRAEARRLAGGT